MWGGTGWGWLRYCFSALVLLFPFHRLLDFGFQDFRFSEFLEIEQQKVYNSDSVKPSTLHNPHYDEAHRRLNLIRILRVPVITNGWNLYYFLFMHRLCFCPDTLPLRTLLRFIL